MEAQYTQLAETIGMGRFEKIAEIFSMIASVDEANLVLALPADVPTLAEKFGRSEDETEEMMELLFRKGLVFKSFKTDPISFRGCSSMGQFHDSVLLWPEAPVEFYDAWKEWSENEGFELAKKGAERSSRPGMRVIPVGVTIDPGSQILAADDIRIAIENAEVLAVTACTCKLAARKCDTSLECCMQLNNAARYAIARGTGRELSKEEAMQLTADFEEEGLVHCVFNVKSMHQVICNCCEDCCENFPVKIKHNLNSVAPSRFQAEIRDEDCTGCELCIERCFFDAIEMNDDTIAELTEPDRCVGCGLCQVVCAPEAIDMKEVREMDYIPESWAH